MEKEITSIIKIEELEKSQAQIILDNFKGFLEDAKSWEIESKSIVVNDIGQVKEMERARELRLIGKNIRVKTENIRKELKEQYLRGGRAVDGVANIIKAIVVPIEEHLEKQEKFAENLRKEELEKIYNLRLELLLKYTDDISFYNYKEMTEDAFNKLVATLKLNHEAEQEAIKQAELERIENEKKQKLEQERIKKENEKLKVEAEAREKELAKERAEQEKKIEVERAKAKVEAEAREKAEKELRDKKEAEIRAEEDRIAKEQAEFVRKAEQEKQVKLAPEKDKLFAWSEKIKMIESPTDLSKAGLQIVKEAEEKLLAISQEIKAKIKNL